MITEEQQIEARERAQYLTSLLWHVGTFVIINAFLWLLDLRSGASGIQWADWISIFWGLALAFHALAYFVDGSAMESRMVRRFLDDIDDDD